MKIKINTKILAWFLFLIVMIFSQLAVNHATQSKILDNIKQVKDIEAPLGIMLEQAIGYDGILTEQVQVVLHHAQEGEHSDVKEHKERYDEIKTKLDDLLKKDVLVLLNQSERPQDVKGKIESILKNLDRLNLLLVGLETRAFDAIEKKDFNKAYSLIIGEDHTKYKMEFYQEYTSWSDIEKEMSVSMRNNILKDSQWLIYLNLMFSVIVIVILLIIILIIRSLVLKCLREEIN